MANIIIYTGLELSYILNCAAHFAIADGKVVTSKALTKAAGACGFVAALAGFYVVAHELCQSAIPFDIPLGDTSRFARRKKPGLKWN